MLPNSSSTKNLSIRPRLSHIYSNQSDISICSAVPSGTTRHGHYNFSTQLTNKSWIRMQVDSIHFDLKNDTYEIKLSDSQIMSFDFTSKSCSLRIPSDKVEIDKSIIHLEETPTDDFDDIDEMLKEIDNQSNCLQIANIQSEWKQLQDILSKYKTNSANSTPKNVTTTKNITRGHNIRPSNVFHYKSCCFSIEQCPHIQHIVFILGIYMKYLNYKTKQQLYNEEDIKKLPISVTEIINCLDNYSKTQLLNDYLHIKKQHYNTDEFHELKSYIKTKTPLCQDIKTCICCNRNKENNQIYKNLTNKTRRDLYLINTNEINDASIEEMNEINLQKYIDIIHSTLIHQQLSDDVNYKFTSHLSCDNNSPIQTTRHTNDVSDEEKDNIIGGGSEYDFSVTDSDEFNSFCNIEEYIHKFGDKYSYWNPKMDDYIEPKYNDLKTELLCQGMTNNDYKILYERSCDFLKCDMGLNMNCRRQFSWMHKFVKIGQKISIDHIIALFIYTNYIDLRDDLILYGFKYDKINEKTEENKCKKRHCDIAHFFRLLKETIYCFGDSLSERSKLYHGIDIKLMFNTVNFSFNIPLSSTIKYSIAPISQNGICIKFGKPLNAKNYYFDVSDISQFPDEKERIIFGGEPFGIIDIISNGHSHSEQIMSLKLYQEIINGNWFTNNKELMKTKYQRRIIKSMNSMMNLNANMSPGNNYIMELFKNISILQLKYNTIWINKQEMELCLPELKKLFEKQFKNYLIKEYNVQIKYNDILEMNLQKEQIEMSSFRKSIYSKLYTYKLNTGEKVSFVFRCFQKYDQLRNENMFRGFIAIKYLPKSNVIQKIHMRYGLYFPQKVKLSKWENCVLGPTNLYKGNSIFTTNEIKNIDMLQIKICFQILKVE